MNLRKKAVTQLTNLILLLFWLSSTSGHHHRRFKSHHQQHTDAISRKILDKFRNNYPNYQPRFLFPYRSYDHNYEGAKRMLEGKKTAEEYGGSEEIDCEYCAVDRYGEFNFGRKNSEKIRTKPVSVYNYENPFGIGYRLPKEGLVEFKPKARRNQVYKIPSTSYGVPFDDKTTFPVDSYGAPIKQTFNKRYQVYENVKENPYPPKLASINELLKINEKIDFDDCFDDLPSGSVNRLKNTFLKLSKTSRGGLVDEVINKHNVNLEKTTKTFQFSKILTSDEILGLDPVYRHYGDGDLLKRKKGNELKRLVDGNGADAFRVFRSYDGDDVGFGVIS